MRARSNSETGFTLVELVIVVGIIGLLAAIAIPNFLSYQARSRRSEAYVNLAAIARIQSAYHAERGEFFEAGSWPKFVDLSARKMEWDAASELAYSELGWRPEGWVYYSYDTNTGATACKCSVCFTATAAGDVDDDDLNSAVMYVHPETNAAGVVLGECPSGLFGFGTPIDSATGQPVYDRVAVQRSLDQY